MKEILLNTTQLQSMLTKAQKAVGDKKDIPKTGMICIRCNSDRLTVITNDGSNFLYLYDDSVKCEERFCVVAEATKLIKLISRMTCKEISLNVVDDVLIINGNGEYKMELPLDNDGTLVSYPDPLEAFSTSEAPEKISIADIKLITNTAKGSLASDPENPSVYDGYYIGDKVIATNSLTVCGIDKKIFATPEIIRPRTFDLLSMFDESECEVRKNDRIIVYEGQSFTLYSMTLEESSKYSVSMIEELLSLPFNSECSIKKDEILGVLDRISLMVDEFEDVTIVFSKDELEISSKSNSGVELIKYKEETGIDFSCSTNVVVLKNLIKTQDTDWLKLSYGNEQVIKFTDGIVTTLVALDN